MSRDLQLYIDVIYGDDDKLARYVLGLEGTVTILADEGDETKPAFAVLPSHLISPSNVERSVGLNFSMGRFRGMREDERIGELVTHLSIQEKMALVQVLELSILPPMLLGVVESVVLAAALLEAPETYLVCRRIRLAYALTQQHVDESHQRYDYDTVMLYLAHLYNLHSEEDPTLLDMLGARQTLLPGVVLHRPMDIMVYEEYVIVAEGGDDTRDCVVHIWTKRKQHKLE